MIEYLPHDVFFILGHRLDGQNAPKFIEIVNRQKISVGIIYMSPRHPDGSVIDFHHHAKGPEALQDITSFKRSFIGNPNSSELLLNTLITENHRVVKPLANDDLVKNIFIFRTDDTKLDYYSIEKTEFPFLYDQKRNLPRNYVRSLLIRTLNENLP